MKRKWLAVGISIFAVILLTLTSLSNVVGYQSVQTSQKNLIKERINQRELLFQTIVDIANNKEIQRIILKSQMSRGIFPPSEIPVITKQQIRQMYFIGLILSKVVIKSRIQSMVHQYQFNNQNIQMEMYSVIEKDTSLNSEITQLKDFDCDCNNNNDTTFYWRFPMICLLLLPSLLLNFFLYIVAIFIWGYLGFYPPVLFFEHKLDKFDSIGFRLSCFWWHFMFSEW